MGTASKKLPRTDVKSIGAREEEKKTKRMEKTRLNGGNKSKEKLSRFFTDTTRNKNNIEKRKNELRDRGMRASKHKNSGDQECRLFFRIMNVGGLNKTKLTLI